MGCAKVMRMKLIDYVGPLFCGMVELHVVCLSWKHDPTCKQAFIFTHIVQMKDVVVVVVVVWIGLFQWNFLGMPSRTSNGCVNEDKETSVL